MITCPLPLLEHPHILLGHGSGGKLTRKLISDLFYAGLGNPYLAQDHDATRICLASTEIAITTDSFVVSPLKFPGGDIGKLAICGTVNDLAMAGATPQYLTAGFILEEGLPISLLWDIIQSMRDTADQCGISIVTGDTKVVERGKGDGIFINTTGIGVIASETKIHPSRISVGDLVILSGDIGRHGMALMSVRENLSFDSLIMSDVAPLHNVVLDLLAAGITIHCLRDLTRGGLATAAFELAQACELSIHLNESDIVVHDNVQMACEILGLDPMYVANEGKMMIILPHNQAMNALNILQKHEVSHESRIVGEVQELTSHEVLLKTTLGTHRALSLLTSEQLPRIC